MLDVNDQYDTVLGQQYVGHMVLDLQMSILLALFDKKHIRPEAAYDDRDDCQCGLDCLELCVYVFLGDGVGHANLRRTSALQTRRRGCPQCSRVCGPS